MTKYKDVILSVLAGLVLGAIQGQQTLPGFTVNSISNNLVYGIAGFACFGGILMGMHFLSRANSDTTKLRAFGFFLALGIAIGFSQFIKHYNGDLFVSILLPSIFFFTLSIALIIGGLLSVLFSKNT